jgi:hypothetical protein
MHFLFYCTSFFPSVSHTLFLSAALLHCFALLSLLAVFFPLSRCSLIAFVATLALSVLTLKVIDSSLNCDCVDYFASFLSCFSPFLLITTSCPLILFFLIALVHIVTYCSYRTTTKLLLYPLRYFHSSIDHTYPLMVLVVFSLPFLYFTIPPLDHNQPAICYL